MNLKVAKLFGTPVYLNWTFLLLMLGVFLYAFTVSGSALVGAIAVGGGLVLFSCVLVHEFAHVLAARYFGISTASVTMYFIGGMARLELIPRGSFTEFWIAVAGPLSNLVMAGIAGAIGIGSGNGWYFGFDPVNHPYMSFFSFNVIIAAFNLLPAFPMDGGRILRSLIAQFTDYVSATKWASIIGRLFGVAFIVIGIWYPIFMLIFIGGFVYLAAKAEYDFTKQAADADSAKQEQEPLV